MCVAIPARITAIRPGPLPMAETDQAGATVTCCLAYVPEAQVGDYVLIQQHFAVQVLDAASAALSLAAFAELGYPVEGGGPDA
ncbi:MAG: HypC/HybG/HupF family hydrogenase formation chaperone [Bifidobacteriaceae bacterium]|jgi:hydrogenase expression/formation protein HypC|nr:HypC/HybG/HupF family hydrogenase formation chaperone [Bifidobacteriaceae bacterium]